ncbi:MAG: hypothetical protein IPK75_12885 [Acidobacteria bacterium]|nr:hypothetical protein [Acidobacteriota bacterium]
MAKLRPFTRESDGELLLLNLDFLVHASAAHDRGTIMEFQSGGGGYRVVVRETLEQVQRASESDYEG